MQREIKFRCWDKKRKEWFGASNPSCLTFYDFGIFGECTYFSMPPVEELANLILLQFTGRKDCKGVEIFEDHIVRIEDGRVGKVIYDPAIFRIVDKNGDFITSGYPDWDLCRVLGNIYENPELL